MGVAVIEQWTNELAHCREWGLTERAENAEAQLRALGADVGDQAPTKKAAPRKATKKATQPEA